MKKQKEIPTKDILNELINKDVSDLIAISKLCAEILADHEREAEQKLQLIRNGGK